jgi:hypothetical protein
MSNIQYNTIQYNTIQYNTILNKRSIWTHTRMKRSQIGKLCQKFGVMMKMRTKIEIQFYQMGTEMCILCQSFDT